MKRIGWICLLMIACSLPGYSQFWISFGWNEPHCQSCGWMEEALRLSPARAAEYHKIIHKYGQRIEREARRDCRYWDKSASKIYNLRMERDRRIQRLLTPSQFALYVRFVREHPQRIHDYRGWYHNPHYPHYHPTPICTRYEDNYWKHNWGHAHEHRDNHPAYRPDHGHGRPSPGHTPGRPVAPPPSHGAHPRSPHSQKPGRHERSSKPRREKDKKEKDKKEKSGRERGRSYSKGRD